MRVFHKVLFGTMIVLFAGHDFQKRRRHRKDKKNALQIKHAALIKYFRTAFPYY